jgi:hypothetical protein
MELLLNFLWLMLALPAFWIGLRQPTAARDSGRAYRSHSFVLLGFLLALLFPVVSATDDLHPIRAEIEECSPSKRVVKASPGAKSPVWSHEGGPAARLVSLASLRPKHEAWGPVSKYLPVLPQKALAATLGGRAPPAS